MVLPLILTAVARGQDAPPRVTLTEAARVSLAEHPEAKRPDHVVSALAYSADGRTLAVGLLNPHIILLLDPVTLATRGELVGHLGLVAQVVFTPDGQTLVSAGHDGTVRVWDVAARRERQTIDQFQGNVRGLALSPDGTRIYTGEAIPGAKGKAQSWDLATGRLLGGPVDYDHGIEALALSPDGRTMATSSRDRTIRLWDTTTWTQTASFDAEKPFANDLAFAPDGRSLAAAFDDQSLRLVDLPKLEPRVVKTLGGGSFLYLDVAPVGATLAQADSNRLRLWDLADGTPLGEVAETGGKVYAIRFAPDGRSIAVGGRPGFVRVYRVDPTGK